MLFDAVIIAFIVAMFMGGKLTNFADLDLKWLPLPIIAFALEAICGRLLFSDFWHDIIIRYNIYIFLFEYYLLFIFFAYNLKNDAVKIIAFGMFLNFTVMFFNGGYMPVDTAMAYRYGFHTSLKGLYDGMVFCHKAAVSGDPFLILGDVIEIPPPYPMPKTISIGDVFLDIGVFILILHACLGRYSVRDNV